MSVQILEGEKHACLFCNTTDWAFGPLFEDAEQASDSWQRCQRMRGGFQTKS